MPDLPALESLLATAHEIRDRTTEGGNTADIVGGFLENVISYLQDVYDKLTSGSTTINELKVIPLSIEEFTETGGSITDPTYSFNYRKLVIAGKGYDINLPDAEDCIGKALILHNSSSDYALTIQPYKGNSIVDNAEGLSIGTKTIKIILAVSATEWVVVK